MKPNNIPSNISGVWEESCTEKTLYWYYIYIFLLLLFLKDQSDREKKDMKNTQEKIKAAKVTQSFRVRWGVKGLA